MSPSSEEMTEAEFGELIEAMLFWLIGLLAPALVGLPSCRDGRDVAERPGRRSAKNSSSSQKQPFHRPSRVEVATHCTDGAGEVREVPEVPDGATV